MRGEVSKVGEVSKSGNSQLRWGKQGRMKSKQEGKQGNETNKMRKAITRYRWGNRDNCGHMAVWTYWSEVIKIIIGIIVITETHTVHRRYKLYKHGCIIMPRNRSSFIIVEVIHHRSNTVDMRVNVRHCGLLVLRLPTWDVNSDCEWRVPGTVSTVIFTSAMTSVEPTSAHWVTVWRVSSGYIWLDT